MWFYDKVLHLGLEGGQVWDFHKLVILKLLEPFTMGLPEKKAFSRTAAKVAIAGAQRGAATCGHP